MLKALALSFLASSLAVPLAEPADLPLSALCQDEKDSTIALLASALGQDGIKNCALVKERGLCSSHSMAVKACAASCGSCGKAAPTTELATAKHSHRPHTHRPHTHRPHTHRPHTHKPPPSPPPPRAPPPSCPRGQEWCIMCTRNGQPGSRMSQCMECGLREWSDGTFKCTGQRTNGKGSCFSLCYDHSIPKSKKPDTCFTTFSRPRGRTGPIIRDSCEPLP